MKIGAECKSHLEGFKPSNTFLFKEVFLSPGYGMLQDIFTLLIEVVFFYRKEFKIHRT